MKLLHTPSITPTGYKPMELHMTDNTILAILSDLSVADANGDWANMSAAEAREELDYVLECHANLC